MSTKCFLIISLTLFFWHECVDHFSCDAMKRAVLSGCQTEDITSKSRGDTQWTALGPVPLSPVPPFCETRLGSTSRQARQPQRRGPVSKLDLEINEAEHILEQCRSKNAKLQEFKANLDDVVSVRRRELELIHERLTQFNADSGSTMATQAGVSKLDDRFVTPSASEVHRVVARLVRLFERQALLETRYRSKKCRSEKLASFLKSASVDQVKSRDAFVKVRPPLPRERAQCCQEELRKNEMAQRARDRRLQVAHHAHLKEERKKMGKDVETELLRLKRQSAEKKRAKKLDILRKQRKAQLDAEFECLKVEDQQQQKQQYAAAQPEGELDCMDSLLHETAHTHIRLTQPSTRVCATLRVALSDPEERHEKEAARLVDWLKTVTSVVGIPALSAFEGTVFSNSPIKISEDGVISIEFEVDPNSVGRVERAFKFVCPQRSENITLTVGSCVQSDATHSLAKEDQYDEGAVHMFGILLDEATSIGAGLNHLVRDDTPLSRVNWLDDVDIVQKPRNMIILRAHLADDFTADDILHELNKFTTFACRVTDAVTSGARRISLNTIATVDHTALSFVHEDNSSVEDNQDTATLQDNPSDLESDISVDNREEEHHQDVSEKPTKDAEGMEDRAGDRKQIVFTREDNARHKILDLRQTSKPQLLSKDNKSREESARSLVSSDPSADTRIVRFNVKFTPGQDPSKVAACAFSLECVKKSCEWDLDDVTFAPNPTFPAVLLTAILFEGVDREVVYDALCRELIENPKNLMVTFVDYLYDWDQPTDAIKLLRADLEVAVSEASLLQERPMETVRISADRVEDLESAPIVANMPAAFQSQTTPSSSSAFGSLQKELAFIGLSEYYATLRDLGVTDLMTLASMSQAGIRAAAQEAGMTDDHHVRLVTLAEEFAGGIVDKARRQSSFVDPNTVERKAESLFRKRFEDAREATNNMPIEIEAGIQQQLTFKREIEMKRDSSSDNDARVDCQSDLNSVVHEDNSNKGEASNFSRPSLSEQEETHQAVVCRISSDAVDELFENAQNRANNSTLGIADSNAREQKKGSVLHEGNDGSSNIDRYGDDHAGYEASGNNSTLDMEDSSTCEQNKRSGVHERNDGSSDHDRCGDDHAGYEAKESDDTALQSCTQSRLKEEATDNAIAAQFLGEHSSSNEFVADIAAAQVNLDRRGTASRMAENSIHCLPGGKQYVEGRDISPVLQEHSSKSDHSPAIFDSLESDKSDITTSVTQKSAQQSEDALSNGPAASADVVSLQANLTPLTVARETQESSAAHVDALDVGSRVDVNYRGLGSLYSGTISQINSDGTYTVNYDDGEIESSIPKASIYSSEVTTKSTINFAIGTRVEVNYRAMDVYYPGAIAGIHPDGTFDIHYDDGDREDRVDPIMLRPLCGSDRPHDYISDPSMDSIDEMRHTMNNHSSLEDAPAPSLESNLRHGEKCAIGQHAPSTDHSNGSPGSSTNRLAANTSPSPKFELDTSNKSGPAGTPDCVDSQQSQAASIAAFVAGSSCTHANDSETEPKIESGTKALPVVTDKVLGVDVAGRDDHVEIEDSTLRDNPPGLLADVSAYTNTESNDDNENLDSEHAAIHIQDSKDLAFGVARNTLNDIDGAETSRTLASRHDEKDETVAYKSILNTPAPCTSLDKHLVEAGTKRDIQMMSEGVPIVSIYYEHEQSKVPAADSTNVDTNRAVCSSPSPSGRLEAEPATTPVTGCSTTRQRPLSSTSNIAPDTELIASATKGDFERAKVTSRKTDLIVPPLLNSKFKDPIHPTTEDNYLEHKGLRDSIMAVGGDDLFGKDTLQNTDSDDSGSPLASSNQAGSEDAEDKRIGAELSPVSARSLGTQLERKDVSMSLHGGNHEQSQASSAGTLGFSTNFSADDEPFSAADDMPYSNGDSARSGGSYHSQGGETSASGDASLHSTLNSS